MEYAAADWIIISKANRMRQLELKCPKVENGCAEDRLITEAIFQEIKPEERRELAKSRKTAEPISAFWSVRLKSGVE